jgi:hypothetical protein
MSTQSIKFDYDPERNILFTEDDFNVATEQEVDEFIRQNLEQFRALGHPVYMISKIDGLHIGARISQYYGQRSREVFRNHILGFARYGENPSARMTVRTASRKAGLESNICNTREEAVRVIEQLKQDGGKQG